MEVIKSPAIVRDFKDGFTVLSLLVHDMIKLDASAVMGPSFLSEQFRL